MDFSMSRDMRDPMRANVGFAVCMFYRMKINLIRLIYLKLHDVMIVHSLATVSPTMIATGIIYEKLNLSGDLQILKDKSLQPTAMDMHLREANEHGYLMEHLGVSK